MSTSIQHKIGNIRPPRVHITYDLETDGAIISKELPLVIGIIAPCSASDTINYEERQFIQIDRDNFNKVLSQLAPTVELQYTINQNVESCSLSFRKMEDFSPIEILKQVPSLWEMYNLKLQFFDLKLRLTNSSKLLNLALQLQQTPNMDLETLFMNYKFVKEVDRSTLFSLFNLLKTILKDSSRNLIVLIQEKISELETTLCQCLDQILHQEHLQRLEGTWRGLFYLATNMETGTSIKLRVLNASIDDLRNDLNNAIEFDQSFLFKKLYEEEYGTYGGNPYTCLGIDHYVTKYEEDITFLKKLIEVVAAAHIPTFLGTHASMFDLESFTDLHYPRDLSKIFESPSAIQIRSLKTLSDAKYLGLLMPRYMTRMPYNFNHQPIEGLNYEEKIEKHDDLVWGNCIYQFLRNIAVSFAMFCWFSSIVGPENGGKINDLPVFLYETQGADMAVKCPTECTITDRREKELASLGFISLCYCKDTDYATFFSSQSFYKAPLFDKASANANAFLSSRLHYMLNVSRFAHYIKCILRDKIGSFSSQESVNNFLNNWICQYVLLNDTESQEIKARYPLSGASVKVQAREDKPGVFDIVVLLRPHFQMEELTVSLRLVATIGVSE